MTQQSPGPDDMSPACPGVSADQPDPLIQRVESPPAVVVELYYNRLLCVKGLWFGLIKPLMESGISPMSATVIATNLSVRQN